MRGTGRLPLRPRLPGLKGPKAPHAIASPLRPGPPYTLRHSWGRNEPCPPSPGTPAAPAGSARCRARRPVPAPAAGRPGAGFRWDFVPRRFPSPPRLGSARPGGLPAAPCSPRCCAWAAGPGLPLRAGSACSCGRCWAAARPRRGAAAGRSGRCTAQVTTPGPRGVARPGIPTAPHWPPSPRPIHGP